MIAEPSEKDTTFTSTERQPTQEEKLLSDAAQGDVAAHELLTNMVTAIHVWDDLIDRDKEVSNGAINNTFVWLLVKLPMNTFYQENFSRLHAVIANSICSWLIANRFERKGDNTATKISYVLRSNFVDLISTVALIRGGYDLSLAIAATARDLAYREGYEEYIQQLRSSASRSRRDS